MKRLALFALIIAALTVGVFAQTKVALTTTANQDKGWAFVTAQYNAAQRAADPKWVDVTVAQYQQARFDDLGNDYAKQALAGYTALMNGAIATAQATGDEVTLDVAAKALRVTRPVAPARVAPVP